MIETADQKAAFDRQVKQILSYKPFLAWILKTCVDKFSGVSIEEIEGCIEGKPSVAEMAVHQDEQIRGDNTADTSIDEGLVTYDIRFTALTTDSVRPIELFINIEGQYCKFRSNRAAISHRRCACFVFIGAEHRPMVSFR